MPATVQTVADGVDTVTDAVTVVPQAEVTEASLDYTAASIRMNMRVARPTDPMKDPNWESDDTYALWSLDTTGDGSADYTLEYSVSDGELYGRVYRSGAPDHEPAVCDATAADFSPADGYTVVVGSECLGRPEKVGYSVSLSYDTEPSVVRQMTAPRTRPKSTRVLSPTGPIRPGNAAGLGIGVLMIGAGALVMTKPLRTAVLLH